MKIIFISGPEATGKTFVGKEIADVLKYAYHSKDQIKEHLFDTESHNTWNYSWYENKAKAIFFSQIREIIASNQSAVVESNFNNKDKTQLSEILNDNVEITEIFCTSKGLTSIKRFVKRNEDGIRHKGHHDRRWYANVLFQNILRQVNIDWPHKPLGFSEQIQVVDTTNFAKVNMQSIINNIKYSVYHNK